MASPPPIARGRPRDRADRHGYSGRVCDCSDADAGQSRRRLPRWGGEKLVECPERFGWAGRTYQGAPIPNGSPASSPKRGGDSRSGGRVMDRSGRTVFPGLSHFLVVAVCASFAGVLPVRALEPAATAPTKLADGIWIVQGRAIPGTGHCGDRLVRLTNRQAPVRCHRVCTSERADREPCAATGRELLGNYAWWFGRIETRTCLQNHWEVFGGDSQPYPRN